jgi:hypothetical protein
MRPRPSVFGVAALALAGLACPALTESGYPPEVQAVLDAGRKYCLEEGGSGLEFDGDPVRKVDLTGQGRSDYIIWLRNVQCIGRTALFCGTGGCQITILVAQPNGKLVQVFDDYVWHYEIGDQPGRKTVRFQVHHSFCDPPQPNGCIKSRRITYTPFSFSNR